MLVIPQKWGCGKAHVTCYSSVPLLPGWPAAERWPESRLGKSKEVAAATVEEEKKNPTNNSAIVLEQLNQEVLIGKTEGCDFLVGYFLLCCMRDLFLTTQGAWPSALGTEWCLILTCACKRCHWGTTRPTLGCWSLLGTVSDLNNPGR